MKSRYEFVTQMDVIIKSEERKKEERVGKLMTCVRCIYGGTVIVVKQ